MPQIGVGRAGLLFVLSLSSLVRGELGDGDDRDWCCALEEEQTGSKQASKILLGAFYFVGGGRDGSKGGERREAAQTERN